MTQGSRVKGEGVGVEFLDLSPADRGLIETFVATQQATDAVA